VQIPKGETDRTFEDRFQLLDDTYHSRIVKGELPRDYVTSKIQGDRDGILSCTCTTTPAEGLRELQIRNLDSGGKLKKEMECRRQYMNALSTMPVMDGIYD